MKILHSADLHARRESSHEFRISCESILKAAKKHEVSLIALSGDIWHGPTQNSAGSLFPDFIEAIRSLGDIAPVAMIYGTPSHDVEGSLEIFETMDCKYGIKILRPGIAYILKEGKIEELQGNNEEDARLLLFGIPEPSKRWVVASNMDRGAQSADMSAEEAFRMLCIATGCMRERYPQLPALVLAHGQVEGARTSHNVMLSMQDSLHFTKDDLKALKAEYIALGDIHQPQHIEGTRAWYAGSAYPLDFGETHKAGCWIVEIPGPGSPVEMIREEFPHPVCKHLISSAACAMEIPSMHGQKVWYEVQGTRQELAHLDSDEVLARLLAHGAAKGSKVSFDISGNEPARAAEIRDKKGIEEKLKTWAAASREEVTERVLEKARILERETIARNHVPAQARYRIDRLILRGANGLWAKSKKEEIDLDLASKGPGVLVVIGPNGAGKTTILENLHPWPRLLTREGPLRDHFMRADSFRDLYLTDVSTNCRYRCLIRMRADIPSGSTEYWLFRDSGNGFAPLPEINGRLEPYEEWVERLFGSLQLYQRTAFTTQKMTKNCPDLSMATKGERKALFSELCGTDWLEAYREAVKEKGDLLAAEIRNVEAKHSMLKESESRCRFFQEQISEYAAQIDEKTREESALIPQLSAARQKRAEIEHLKQEREYLIRARELANKRIVSLKEKEREYMSTIESYRASLRIKDQMEAEITRAQRIEEKREALLQEKQAHENALQQEMREYLVAMNNYTEHRNNVIADLNKVRVSMAELQEKTRTLKAHLSIPLGENCPACGQILAEEAREKQQRLRAEQETMFHSLEEQLAQLSSRKKTLDAQLDELYAPLRPEKKEFSQKEELENLNKELASIDLGRAYDMLRRADIAQGTIEHIRKELAKLEDEIGEASKHAEDCEASLKALPAQHEEIALNQACITLEDNLATLKLEIAKLQTRREETEKMLAEAKKNLGTFNIMTEQLKSMTGDLCDWALLERAASKDGIQALELDALAPGISAIATKLLAASGNEGSIAIKTLRLAGKGAKQHAIEDFNIIYTNARGDEQEIATLSSGEAVWIRKAIYDAFEVIRAQNVGLQFCTVILDEADGALDPEARMRYMRMINSAHRESGRFQTIIVTHSRELQDMADMSISIDTLQPSNSEDSKEQQLALSA